MIQKKLPGTDLTVSAICLGTAPYGNGIPVDDAFDQLDRFQAAGGNLIDTANIYGKWCPDPAQQSEPVIGRYIRERGRGNLILSTKGAHPPIGLQGPFRISEKMIRDDLEHSLRDLGVETIDLYWLHRDSPAVPVGEIIGVLEDLRREGKIRYYGGSNWSRERLEQARAYAKEAGAQGFTAVQNRWSLARTEQADLQDQTTLAVDAAMAGMLRERREDFSLFSFSAMGHGLFTKWAAEPEGPAPEALRAEYGSPINRRRLRALLRMSEETGLPVAALVLAWQVSQPFTALPIVAVSRLGQLKDVFRAGSTLLSEEQVDALNCGEPW